MGLLGAAPALARAEPPERPEGDGDPYGVKWAEVRTTENYKIHTMVGGDLADRVAWRQEAILEKYKEIFPKKYFPRVDDDFEFPVLVFENRGQFERFARSNGADPTNMGGYFSPSHGYTVLYWDSDQTLFPVLHHEAFHQFLFHILTPEPDEDGKAPPRVTIPRWLDEGLGDYFAGARVDEQKKTLKVVWPDIDVTDINMTRKAMLTNTHIPLERLMLAPRSEFYDEDKMSLYYSHGLSVVFFLMHYGKDGQKGKKMLGQYIIALRDGKTMEEAYQDIFEKKIKTLEKSWKKSILALDFDKKR